MGVELRMFHLQGLQGYARREEGMLAASLYQPHIQTHAYIKKKGGGLTQGGT